MCLKKLISRSIELNIKRPDRHENMIKRSRDLPLIIIGDLHGERDSLKEILEITSNEGDSFFLFLGTGQGSRLYGLT